MLRQDEKILIVGPSGSGKSTITKKLSNAFPRLVVIDTMSEYRQENDDDFVATNPRELAQLAKLIILHKPKTYRILYQSEHERDDREELDECLEILYNVRNLHIIIEELPQYTTAAWMPVGLKKMILVGRHKGIGITATSQRPAEIPKTFISQCAHVFSSRFIEPNDVKYLEANLGSNFINSMRNLKKYEFFHYSRDGKNSILRA